MLFKQLQGGFYSNWDKLVPGGVILLDDYGWPGHEEQKKAIDEFVKKVKTKVLYFPTGHGVIIK